MPLSLQTCSLTPSSSSLKGRVLIVDDEENVAVLLQHILARLEPDLELRVANSGAQALEFLSGERLDLLITDYQMPHMNGLELTATVRQRWPEVKIILMTAYSTPDIVDRAEKLAVDCYLTKPFSSQELWQMICRLVNSSTSLSAALGGGDHGDNQNQHLGR